jgi:uncharacterized protein (PEP-CTERM system associated)
MHGRRESGSAGGDESKSAARRRAGWSAVLGGVACAALSTSALAEKWTLSASAGASATYNHYFGANQPADGFVTCLSGSIGIRGETARLKVSGNLGATAFFCTGQPSSFAPAVNLIGTLEVIEKFFFVEASANASTSYVTPFGPQPSNITVQTNNRYISQTYSVSPYIQGVMPNNITYSLRDDNIWTPSSSYGDSSAKVPTTYQNNVTGQMSSTIGSWGWALQYNSQYYDNGLDTGTYFIQVARGIVSYQVDPQLSVSLRGGYEIDRFPGLTDNNGALLPSETNGGVIYGAGLDWRPTPRTELNGYWEHRFFGSSYNWQLTHRLPNIALSATFTRGLSTYPQLALAIPAGITVAQFLDAAFTTRIPDPAQRAAAVAQFLAQTGLPPTLASPLNYYAATITVQQQATLGAVWVGALNALGFSLFRTETEAISGSGSALPPIFSVGTNSIQTGAGVNYSHRLGPFTNLVANATYTRTRPTSTEENANNVSTNNLNTFVSVNHQFSPKTSGTVGVSYYYFDTPGTGNFANQGALSVYATVSHTF